MHCISLTIFNSLSQIPSSAVGKNLSLDVLLKTALNE